VFEKNIYEIWYTRAYHTILLNVDNQKYFYFLHIMQLIIRVVDRLKIIVNICFKNNCNDNYIMLFGYVVYIK